MPCQSGVTLAGPALQPKEEASKKWPQNFKMSAGADLSSVGGEDHEDIASSAGGEKRREAERLKASLGHGGDDGQGAVRGKRDGLSPHASTVPDQAARERGDELEKLRIRLTTIEATKDDEKKGQGGNEFDELRVRVTALEKASWKAEDRMKNSEERTIRAMKELEEFKESTS